MHSWGWDIAGWEWAWMTLIMVIAPAVVVVTVLVLARAVQSDGPMSRADQPQDILAQRFARGELSEEEYRRRRDVLAALTGSIR